MPSPPAMSNSKTRTPSHHGANEREHGNKQAHNQPGTVDDVPTPSPLQPPGTMAGRVTMIAGPEASPIDSTTMDGSTSAGPGNGGGGRIISLMSPTTPLPASDLDALMAPALKEPSLPSPQPPIRPFVKWRRRVILVGTLLSVFSSAGLASGFSPLKSMMLRERVFDYLCLPGQDTCNGQVLRMDLMYTLSGAIGSFLVVPTGFLLDRLGPKLLYLFAAVMLAFSLVMFGIGIVLGGAAQNIIIVAFIVMSASGSALYTASFHVANLVPERSAVITLMLNVCFDLSALIFTVLQLIYTSMATETERTTLFRTFFFAFTAPPVLVFVFGLFFMPLKSITPVDEWLESNKVSPEENVIPDGGLGDIFASASTGVGVSQLPPTTKKIAVLRNTGNGTTDLPPTLGSGGPVTSNTLPEAEESRVVLHRRKSDGSIHGRPVSAARLNHGGGGGPLSYAIPGPELSYGPTMLPLPPSTAADKQPGMSASPSGNFAPLPPLSEISEEVSRSTLALTAHVAQPTDARRLSNLNEERTPHTSNPAIPQEDQLTPASNMPPLPASNSPPATEAHIRSGRHSMTSSIVGPMRQSITAFWHALHFNRPPSVSSGVADTTTHQPFSYIDPQTSAPPPTSGNTTPRRLSATPRPGTSPLGATTGRPPSSRVVLHKEYTIARPGTGAIRSTAARPGTSSAARPGTGMIRPGTGIRRSSSRPGTANANAMILTGFVPPSVVKSMITAPMKKNPSFGNLLMSMTDILAEDAQSQSAQDPAAESIKENAKVSFKRPSNNVLGAASRSLGSLNALGRGTSSIAGSGGGSRNSNAGSNSGSQKGLSNQGSPPFSPLATAQHKGSRPGTAARFTKNVVQLEIYATVEPVFGDGSGGVMGTVDTEPNLEEAPLDWAQTTNMCLTLEHFSIERQYWSPFYWLFVTHTVTTALLLNSYLGSINNQIEHVVHLPGVSDNPDQLLSTMLTVWSILLPVGSLVVAPFLIPLLMYTAYHTMFTVVSTMAVVAGIFGLIQTVWAKYVTMVVLAMLRPMVWTFASNYVGKVFGFGSFGRLYGGMVFLLGVMNFVSYGFNIMSLQLGSYTISNAVMLALQSVGLVFPVVLYSWQRGFKSRLVTIDEEYDVGLDGVGVGLGQQDHEPL